MTASTGPSRYQEREEAVWNQILELVGEHNPAAADALRKLAKQPTDKAALAVVGDAIVKEAGKHEATRTAAKKLMPMIAKMFGAKR